MILFQVYECYYDPLDPEFVVINFDPDFTLILLVITITVPCGIMVVTCLYMCICSRQVVTVQGLGISPTQLGNSCKDNFQFCNFISDSSRLPTTAT